jgi:cytochrome c peroxidase
VGGFGRYRVVLHGMQKVGEALGHDVQHARRVEAPTLFSSLSHVDLLSDGRAPALVLRIEPTLSVVSTRGFDPA